MAEYEECRTCPLCAREVEDEDDVLSHQKKDHKRDRKWASSCSKCKLMFADLEHMQFHRQNCDGSGFYSVEVANFVSPEPVETERLEHDGFCNICNQQFHSHRDMLQHQQSEYPTNPQCSKCKRRFSNKHDMKEHRANRCHEKKI